MTVVAGKIYPKTFISVRRRFVSLPRLNGRKGTMLTRISGRREREERYPKSFTKWCDVQMRRCPRPNWFAVFNSVGWRSSWTRKRKE